MILKPNCLLTTLLLIAFALLLLSCLSTPIIKAVHLGKFSDVDYGVFGYCQLGRCTSINVKYTSRKLFPSLQK